MRRHLLILAALLVSSCAKHGEEGLSSLAATNPCGSVGGISKRDVNGAQMLPPDTTDWGWSDDWCPAVEALFAGRPAVTLNTTAPDSLLIACFPNPATSIFNIGFYRDDSSYVDVRFVSAQFQPLAAFDSITADHYQFQAYSLGISTPQTIRAYYRVVRADGSAYRGHGDVQIGN